MPSAGKYTLLALCFSCLWASGFVPMKLALRDAPPFLLMASRFLVAGALLLLYARWRGLVLPRDWRDWRPLVALGLLNNVLYLSLANVLLIRLSAGMGSVLASTNPLLLALVAPRLLGEPLTRRKVAGLLVSYAGVASMMIGRVRAQEPLDAMLLWLGCVGFIVAGTVLFKRRPPPHDLVVVNGGQLLAAGVALVVPAALEPWDGVRLTTTLVLSQLYLVAAVSTGAMMLWLWLLRAGDATRASAWFFANPVLGVLFAAILLDEPLGAVDVAGAAVVGGGIFLVQRG